MQNKHTECSIVQQSWEYYYCQQKFGNQAYWMNNIGLQAYSTTIVKWYEQDKYETTQINTYIKSCLMYTSGMIGFMLHEACKLAIPTKPVGVALRTLNLSTVIGACVKIHKHKFQEHDLQQIVEKYDNDGMVRILSQQNNAKMNER